MTHHSTAPECRCPKGTAVLKVAPGLKVLLTNPYELVLTDSRGSAVVLRDDDLKRPRAPRLYELFRQESFTRDDLTFYVRNPRNDPEVFGYGYSEVEMGMRLVKGFQNALDMNIDIFDRSAIANGIRSQANLSQSRRSRVEASSDGTERADHAH